MAKFITDATYDASYDYATKSYTHHTDRPSTFRARAEFESEEEAKDFAAKLPKYVGLKVSPKGVVTFYAAFTKNLATGERNESSIKRVSKFLEVAEIEWKTSGAINIYASVDDFLRSI